MKYKFKEIIENKIEYNNGHSGTIYNIEPKQSIYYKIYWKRYWWWNEIRNYNGCGTFEYRELKFQNIQDLLKYLFAWHKINHPDDELIEIYSPDGKELIETKNIKEI